tara:strand:+ start:29849 stop:29971 length:123 start_codon:yes stop_codon:yes gene_type:complete
LALPVLLHASAKPLAQTTKRPKRMVAQLALTLAHKRMPAK